MKSPPLDPVLLPLSAESILDSFEVPRCANLFVLGSFARHVTIYSQQVRALNLVFALIRTGRLGRGSSVAIVGGGMAGVTAAKMAASSVPGARITLVEKSGQVTPLQAGSSKRFVHPHIYDWPEEGSNETCANLPVFNWEAGPAGDVAAKFRVEWDNFAAAYGNVSPLICHELKSIGIVSTGFELTCESGGRSTVLKSDIVVLATGFGVDVDPLSREDYWLDNWYGQPRGGPKRWLVSGTGDGGLTDAMRVAIQDFRHEHVVLGLSGLGQDEIEMSRRSAGRDRFGELYHEFGPLFVEALRKGGLSTDSTTLNGPAPWHTLKASLLNRMISTALHDLGALQHHEVRIEMEDINRQRDDRYAVNGFEGTFDHIIIRHGPREHPLDAVLSNAGTDSRIKGGLGELSTRWKSWLERHDPSDDRTRLPAWTDQDLNRIRAFHARPAGWTAATKRPAGEADCVVLHGDAATEADANFRSAVDRAVARCAEEMKRRGGAVYSNPIYRSASRAFTDFRTYEEMIGLLCSAPLLIVDITKFEAAVMILLGVRSAVRRGVTIAVTRQSGGIDHWMEMPFNLREINTVSIFAPPEILTPTRADPANPLFESILAAIDDSTDRHYSDLPGYFELRSRSASESKVDDGHVLVLCPFEKSYVEKFNGNIRGRLEEVVRAAGISAQVHTVAEVASPRLVAARLYGAIRRSFLCVVDWTEWRANVMFEFGIRLASSDQRTACLIDTGRPISSACGTPYAQRELLRRFFSPLVYNGMRPEQQFLGIKNMLEHYRGSAPLDLFGPPDPHVTFNAASKNVDLAVDPSFDGAVEMLSASADELLPDPLNPPPILFGAAPRVAEEAERAANDRYVAAWHYLANRGSSEEILIKVGDELLLRLDDDEAQLKAQITGKIGSKRAAPTDPLALARALKNRARLSRRAGDLDAASGTLGEAIKGLKRLVKSTPPESLSIMERRAALELADCWGSLGGVQREQGRLAEARDSYDQGYKIESDSRLKVANSYNLVNRLLVRLQISTSLDQAVGGVTLASAIKDAAIVVRNQTLGPRRGDPWALADLLTLRLVLGDEAAAREAWEKFLESATVEHSFTSSRRVLAELASLTPDLPSKKLIEAAVGEFDGAIRDKKWQRHAAFNVDPTTGDVAPV